MPPSPTADAADRRVGGLAVYHRAGPPAAPRVVFVHGSMDRGAAFVKSARLLRDLDLVRYDRRGYGRSVGAGLARTVDEQVDDLVAVLDGQPSVVIGHSMGGVIALATAELHPDLVRSVGCYEAPMPWLEWWPGSSAGGAAVSVDDGPEAAAERFMRRIIGDEHWERLPGGTQAQRRAEGPALLADLRAVRTEEAPFELALLPVPVVAGHGSVTAERHRLATRALAEGAPHAELVVIDGAAHHAPVTHPEAFAGLVRRAVARGA